MLQQGTLQVEKWTPAWPWPRYIQQLSKYIQNQGPKTYWKPEKVADSLHSALLALVCAAAGVWAVWRTCRGRAPRPDTMLARKQRLLKTLAQIEQVQSGRAEPHL